MIEPGRDRSSIDRLVWFVVPAASLVLVSVGGARVQGLPLTGEDYGILARIARGEAPTPVTFRPLADLWWRAFHGAFGADARAFHAGSLVLHALCGSMVFAVARRLGAGVAASALAAVLHLSCVAAIPAVAWVAAANRLLSALGALVASVGLARLLRSTERVRVDAGLVVAGIGLQFAANEEVIGTCVLAAGALAIVARRAKRRGAAFGVGVLVVFVVATAVLRVVYRAPDRPLGVLKRGLPNLGFTLSERFESVLGGWGVPWFVFGGLLVVATARALTTGARGRVAFAMGLTAASLVPYGLDDPSTYRFYPTVVGVAVWSALVFGRTYGAATKDIGFEPALSVRVTRYSNPMSFVAAPYVLPALLLVTSSVARNRELRRWEDALEEIATVVRLLEGAGEVERDEVQLVNLELTTSGAVAYFFGIDDPTRIKCFGFYHTGAGIVPPTVGLPDDASGPLLARLPDGTIGWRTTEELRTYCEVECLRSALELLPELTPISGVRLPGRAVSEELLYDTNRVDHEAVLPHWDDRPLDGYPIDVVEAEPIELDYDTWTARYRIRTSGGPGLVAYRAAWLYLPIRRIPPDQALITGLDHTRAVRLEARERSTGERFPVYPADLHGFAIWVPAGDHEIELDFRLATPRELRE